MDKDSTDAITSATDVRKRRFFQFTIRQLLLLLALSGVLLGVLTPGIHRTFDEWRLDANSRRINAANRDLTAAVRNNDLAFARRALQAGADPNLMAGTSQGCLFSTCIVKGELEMLELFLENGADVERGGGPMAPLRSPTYGGSPLFMAAGCDQPPEVRCAMIRLLVDHGADLHRQPAQFNLMDIAYHVSDGQVGDLLREYGFAYGPREMAAFNRLDELKQAIHDDPTLVTQRFPTTWAAAGKGDHPTLLAIALYRGYREMSMFLIEAGAPLDTRQNLGRTLLHEAALGGDPELIRLLVARGLDVNAIDEHFKDTPLECAASHDKREAVAALLEAGADVNHQDISGRTQLHAAVSGNHVEVVERLLAAGADPTIADKKDETPLDLARARNPRIAELLQQSAKHAAKAD